MSNNYKYDQVFSNLLRQYSLQFWGEPQSQFFSPYVALFQSSMTGKSRMLEQVAQKQFFTVFICLRTKSIEMPPRQSKPVLDVMSLASRTSGEHVMGCVIKAYIREFMQWLRGFKGKNSFPTPNDWHTYQTSDIDQKVCSAIDKAIFAADYDWGLSDWQSVSEVLRNFYDEREGLDVLFVFDEARSLLNKVDNNNRTLFRYFA